MHAKPDLRVFLEWKIYRPGSVITAVMFLRLSTRNAVLAQICNSRRLADCGLLRYSARFSASEIRWPDGSVVVRFTVALHGRPRRHGFAGHL